MQKGGSRSPGQVLAEEFLPRLAPELRDQGVVADRLRVSRRRLNEILNQKRAVTPDTALRLARFFGTSAEFWLDLQARWELQQELRSRRKRAEVEWIRPAELQPLDAGAAAPMAQPDHAVPAPAEELGLRLAAEAIAAQPFAPGAASRGPAPYYEEFLEKRGLLAEARRFVRIRAQVDAVEAQPSPAASPKAGDAGP